MNDDNNDITSQLPTSIDAMVDMYVRLRDRIKEAEKAHEAKLKPAKDFLEQLNGAMLAKLGEIGVESAKTKFGTAYKITKKSATIADGEAFRTFIIAEGAYDLVDWRANANAVSDYIDDNEGDQPPGVNYSTFTTAGVRRG